MIHAGAVGNTGTRLNQLDCFGLGETKATSTLTTGFIHDDLKNHFAKPQTETIFLKSCSAKKTSLIEQTQTKQIVVVCLFSAIYPPDL